MNKKAKIGLIILAFIISILSTKAYATNGKVNQETVRMRKEASTNSSIVTLISLNEEVEVLSEEGEWYKIKYKTYTGYVRKDMLTVEGTVQNNSTENSQNTTSSTETSNKTNTSPVTSNEETNTTTENTENTATTTENTETPSTTTESEENKNQIQTGFIGKVSEKIDLKIVPSINSSDIYSINENTEIKIKDIMNKWCYVETEGNSGWVLKSKIKTQEETKKEETPKAEENTVETEKKDEKTEQTKTTETKTEEKKEETKKTVETTKYVSAETLNMREKAENTANIVSQLKINAKVTVLETTGTWSKIKVNGKTGYVASKYLSDKKVEVTSRSEDLTRTGEQTKNTAKASSESEKNNTEKTTTSNSGTTSGNSVVSYAKQYLGCKYVSGGSSPTTGFDCSGFTSYVYKHFGISISRSSGAQASNGTAVSKSNLQAGDLVIFNNRSNTAIGHVGIYIGGNTFIHAGNSGTGVITTSLSDSYYSSRYVTGRRIIN